MEQGEAWVGVEACRVGMAERGGKMEGDVKKANYHMKITLTVRESL